MAAAFETENLLNALVKNAPPSYYCDEFKAWKEAVAVLAIQVDWVEKLGQDILEAMRADDVALHALTLKIERFKRVCDATGSTIESPVVKEMAKRIIDTTVKNASNPHHLFAIAKFVDKSMELFDPAWYEEVVSAVLAIKFSDNHHYDGVLEIMNTLMWCSPAPVASPSAKRPRESDDETPVAKAAKVA